MAKTSAKKKVRKRPERICPCGAKLDRSLRFVEQVAGTPKLVRAYRCKSCGRLYYRMQNGHYEIQPLPREAR